jgi:probable F420-dependent oxidoreductase
VKFGMSMMGLSPRYYPEIAKGAEAGGFESVWMPEHLMLPATMPPTYPYSETGYAAIDGDTPMYDPWVVMATVAATTSTIRLATNVYVVPLRHPFVTARSVATLDRVSGGRVTLGAGVGWLEEEFDNAGQSFHNRGKRMEEIVPILRRLWSEDVIEHRGEFYDFGPVKFQPKPLQKPNIPIHIGCHGGPALRRAGRIGDGWIEVGSHDFETLEKRLDMVMTARREAGREGEPFEVSSGLGVNYDAVRRCEDLGIDRVIVGPRSDPADRDKNPARMTKDDFASWTGRFAENVIAKM